MTITTLLIANRGEIAIRIARAAAELNIRTVAVYSTDDAASLHVRQADEAYALPGSGAAAYLDMEQILAVARNVKCDAIHPGYGFLSENAEFARRCTERGILFVGPSPEILELFGDKTRARELAQRHRVPVVSGTSGPTSLEQARQFFASLGDGAAMMIKAVAGGGGRGMRAVHHADEIDAAFARCRSEALAAFGNGDVYMEQLMHSARHIEVQVIGDGKGNVSHLGERECSLQRRQQKLVEIAPSPTLSAPARERLAAAAVRLAEAVKYGSLGTFEFLVQADDDASFAFIEANPRLQVEHTVTEQVTGIDLVKAQLQLAGGAMLAELGLLQQHIVPPRGFAIQLRINMETMQPDASVRPGGGTLGAFELPSGPGIRVDSFGYGGYTTNPNFDSLLAKLIVHSPSPRFEDAIGRAYRALCEFRISGVATNIAFLQNLLRHPDVAANRVDTRFVEENIGTLLKSGEEHRSRYFDASGHAATRAGDGASVANEKSAPEGTVPIGTPMHGTVVSIDVREGDKVRPGQQIAVLEAMKMEHIVSADKSGVVRLVAAAEREVLPEGRPLIFLECIDIDAGEADSEQAVDPDRIRPDLAEVRERHAIGLDQARPDAVARRRKTGQRTARENVTELCDPGSFIEYGALAIAAQRRRRPLDELIKATPADGLIAGIGAVNGQLFGDDRSRCMVLSYDYTVLAGTQGIMNHKKTDRMFQIAEQSQLPVVIFAEGGGGRPGDTDWVGVAGLDVMTFIQFARLSGLAPRVGIVSGRCFAGNAALLGCCDVIIATENATIGMGGPAMIEGGGLGVYTPEQVGPVAMQAPNGVIDLVVRDEVEAVSATKQYLSYFQGATSGWKCADQRMLRHVIPENRLRVYDIRKVIEGLADTDSVMELRRQFGVGIVTALIRIEGRPFGLIANNPMHLGGAIDSDAADKAARFMQLCDAFDLPIVSLCDTPGFMVGPDAEKTATVRHVSRMFVTAGSISVPFFTIVLRKGYGLGAQAMAGGSLHASFFSIAWPSGEFGGMGLEGSVRLGFRKELEAVADPEERKALFDKMVAAAYERGKAINMASFLEIDDVIDPAESRTWIMRGLRSAPVPVPRTGKKRPFIDTW
jgi:acetyl/propionyl-CoA carboxylase alpha subunit